MPIKLNELRSLGLRYSGVFTDTITGTQTKKRVGMTADDANLLLLMILAEPTGFEPATSDVTGRRSNQLNYDSALKNSFNASSWLQVAPELLVGGTGFEPVTPGL